MEDIIETWLLNWFAKKLDKPIAELKSKVENNYFDEMWIDSFGFIEFIIEIEEYFKIKFSNDEFQKIEFSYVVGLASIIKGKISDSENTRAEVL